MIKPGGTVKLRNRKIKRQLFWEVGWFLGYLVGVWGSVFVIQIC